MIPGHGRFSPEPVRIWTISDMRDWRDRLLETIDYIREQKAGGNTLDRIQEAGLPGRYGEMDRRPRFVSEEKWIAFVWAQLP